MSNKLYAIEYYDDPYTAPFTKYIYTDLNLATEFAISEAVDGENISGIVEYEFDKCGKYIQNKYLEIMYNQKHVPFIKRKRGK